MIGDQELAQGQIALGLAIRTAREAAGLSRRDLCSVTGVGYDSLSSIETGRRLPNLSTLHRIASALGMTTREVLDGVPPFG